MFRFNTENFLILLGVIILLFLLFREIVTWYWKINKIVNLLEKIEKNTSKDNHTNNVLPSSSAMPKEEKKNEPTTDKVNFPMPYHELKLGKTGRSVLAIIFFVVSILILFSTDTVKWIIWKIFR